MIKLRKGPEPAVLETNRATWERVLRAHDANQTTPSKTELSRYGHPEIKSALLNETSEKCAYCESKFQHIYPGDVEHVVPKRNGHEYRFKWSNLTMACSTCNTNKGIKENLIDPYDDDPETVFQQAGPAMLPDPTNDKAGATEISLGLNRKGLIERRTERLRNLHRMLKIALAQTDPTYREIYLNELRVKETRDGAEYAAMARWYVNDLASRGII
jgi:uncharacterized protein (TIGR02646 family)